MRNLSIKCAGVFVVLMFTFQMVTFSQDWSDSGSSDPFGGDPFNGMIDSTQNNQTIQPQNEDKPKPSGSNPSESKSVKTSTEIKQPSVQNGQYNTPINSATENNNTSIYNSVPQENTESTVQNAVIEGIQLTAEKNEKQPDEKTIACYFIFRDKPSSYYYDVNIREKKVIFEFNDTRVGTSPVPTASELPIKGFTIEQKKVDVNKDVRGLIPEWHDMIRVSFDMEAVPIIHVNDEFSIISFSFKWTTDPAKVSRYTLKDNTGKVILWSTAGIGTVGLGALSYFLLHKEPVTPPPGPLSKDDLPVHSEKNQN
jgi:hypothetical protein